ncbi:aldo/keto reductase [Burkholderia sp. Bp8992]|uniref:aldo/keto reductase n=1 Tax=Burkholderia sp. Bp8992 TaxID=2184554 RepID=UPI000F56A237|nr:aldo/keto reductase [Burkholderia sp. Bp8992]RQS26586.1 aldo/keto reductase [Burkholderia sp. Bp8992]
MHEPQRVLTTASGRDVHDLCVGTMNWSAPVYGRRSTDSSALVVQAALDAGINQFDTADCYAPADSGPTSEQLLGQHLRQLRVDRAGVFIASKCGIRLTSGGWGRVVDNSPEYIVSSCEASLDALQTDYLDLFYLHRLDVGRAHLKASLEALAGLKRAGKIRHIGLSEVDAGTIMEADRILTDLSAGVCRLDAVQSEFSMLRATPLNDGVFNACRERGVRFYAYSPLSRGFLSGATQHIGEEDCRSGIPRYQGGSLEAVRRAVGQLETACKATGMTLNQAALGWIRWVSQNRQQYIHPVIGTSNPGHLKSNIRFGAAADAVFAQFDALIKLQPRFGERYPEVDMQEFQLSN